MNENTVKLTKLNPKLKEFQDDLRKKYDQENKNVQKGQIVFLGSSLMEIFPIDQFQKEGKVDIPLKIYNRGVRATTTQDLLDHIDTLIFNLAPTKIFINIGSNDIGFGVPESKFLDNYGKIVDQIKDKLPNADLYLMAYYPINSVDEFKDPRTGKIDRYTDERTNQNLIEMSQKIHQLADQKSVNYIKVNQGLIDTDGNLKKELTFDGAHLLPAGFEIVLQNMMPYLKG